MSNKICCGAVKVKILVFFKFVLTGDAKYNSWWFTRWNFQKINNSFQLI